MHLNNEIYTMILKCNNAIVNALLNKAGLMDIPAWVVSTFCSWTQWQIERNKRQGSCGLAAVIAMQKTKSQTSNCLPSSPREVSSPNRPCNCSVLDYSTHSWQPWGPERRNISPEQQMHSAAKRMNRGQDKEVCQLKFGSHHYWKEHKATNARISPTCPHP